MRENRFSNYLLLYPLYFQRQKYTAAYHPGNQFTLQYLSTNAAVMQFFRHFSLRFISTDFARSTLFCSGKYDFKSNSVLFFNTIARQMLHI